MIKKTSSFFIVLICSLFLFSCSTRPVKKTPLKAPKSAELNLKSAQNLIKKRKYNAALSQLHKINKSYPNSEVVDDAYLLMGDIYFKQGKYQNAFDSYMSVSESEFFSPQEAYSIYLASRSLGKLGRYDEALALTRRALDIKPLPKETAERIYFFQFKVLSQLGDHFDALKSLVLLSESTTNVNKKKSFKDKAVDYLESRLSEKEIADVADDKEFGPIRGFALFRIALKAYEEKNLRDARGYFQDVTEVMPDSDLAERSQKYLEQIEAQRKVHPNTVGAVLPLSGRHSKVAHRTLKGLQLGLGIYGKNPSKLNLAVIDSEANPDAARRAVERLVVEDHVIGVVGSLLSKTSVAVAAKANELGVPSIALSQKSGITDVGPTVFRNALTSEQLVRRLVKTAIHDYGIKRFAILFPNDRYGVEYTNLFWNEVLANGGSIRAAQAYDPKSKDYAGAIQRLVGTYYLEDRKDEYKYNLSNWLKHQKIISRRITPPNELLPPKIDFQAIFIPDTIRAIELIAPSLHFHEIDGVKLLGTNLWNHPRLTKRSKEYVENSLFVDSLLVTDESFTGSDFYREFVSVFGYKPGIFEAQAYDAGLIFRQFLSSGESSRIGLTQRLNEISQFPGALGSLDISSRREIFRPIVALSVSEGQIRPISSDTQKKSQ